MGCTLVVLCLSLQADPAAFVSLYQQALESRMQQYGPEHPKVARSASDLGLFLRGLGEHQRAAVHLGTALAIDEKTYGPTHPLTAGDLENLASVSGRQDALALYRRATATADPEIRARSWARIAEATQDVAAYRKALEAEEEAAGKSHPRVAVRLNDLALMLPPREAEPLLRRAAAVQAELLGVNHPETATTLNNLANVLLALGNAVEAETLQRRSMAAFEASLGRFHPRTATACSNLADVMMARKRFAAAEALYRRALAIDESVYGAGHTEVAADLRNLAEVLKIQGQTTEARKLLRRAGADR